MRGHRLLLTAGMVFAAIALLCLFACAEQPTGESVEASVPILPIKTTASPVPALITPAPLQPVTVDVRFVGDILVSKAMTNGAALGDGTYDFNGIWEEIRPELSGADIMIGNLETVVAGYENGGYTGFPRFNAPDEYLDAVRNAGFTVLTNTNNHLLDRGVEGALTTVQKIRARGFLQTGVYLSPDEDRILITEVRGVNIALLAYSYRQADKEQPGDEAAMA